MKKRLRICVCILLSFVLCFFALPTSAYAEGNSVVYIGGFPVGISLDIGGLLIESVTGVETDYGSVPVDGLKQGDIILKIDGQDVRSVGDVQNVLTDAVADIELIRDGETITVKVKPVMESYSNLPRLGIKIKDKIFGVGTVTFVRPDGTYAALGHEIYDSDTDTHIPFCDGKICACKIMGIKQGKKNEAGAILASLIPDKVFGSVTCNNRFGIAGKYETDIYKGDTIEVAARSEVKPGAAQIRTTVDNVTEYYDIEIIKASRQSGRKEKGLVFRVTDKRLLCLTGGVVRGMSGSPIVQGGKLVGAVTHVFLNDFTKGYGIYADCLN